MANCRRNHGAAKVLTEHRQHSISIIDLFFRRLTDHFGVDLKAILTDLDLPADLFTGGLYHAENTVIDEICVALGKKCPKKNFLKIIQLLNSNAHHQCLYRLLSNCFVRLHKSLQHCRWTILVLVSIY